MMNNFSPIVVKQSPRISTPGKNLTGLPRTISDTVADIYNAIQKWNNYHLKGIEIIREIVSFMPIDKSAHSKMQDDLQKLTLELHNLSTRCSEIVANIELSCGRIATLVKLNKDIVPFISMPMCKIETIASSIYGVYVEELKNKKLVVENIALSKSESEALFFACLWKYQINIDKMVDMNMEILLTETGHRKIM